MRTAALALALSFTCMTSASAGVSGQGTWESTLLPRDLDGDRIADAFYDTTLDVTWLRDASGVGRLSWSLALQRVQGLSTGGYTDWRLPFVRDTDSPGCTYGRDWTDCGFNVQTADESGVYSELAHLYHVTLGNKSLYDTSGRPRADYGLTNTGDFSGLVPWDYWSATELTTNQTQAWYFYMIDGAQLVTDKSAQMYLLVLRDGDVAPVPEAGSLTLLLAGMGGLLMVARNKRRAATTTG